MNKSKNALLAIIFMVPILFLATSCSDDDDNNGWSDAEIDQLVSECVSDEQGTQEQCECFADKVTGDFSREQVDNEELSDADIVKLLSHAVDCGISISFE